MKLSLTVLATALVAALAPAVSARNCKAGLDYCWQTLLDIGHYGDQTLAAAKAAGYDAHGPGQPPVLFHCDGGVSGDIHFVRECPGRCSDGGDGTSDYCQ
ncbi:hypothetical protein HKX48_001671 [Thoreauomyces humboldtii]|nr:hypothetical protein HKX48_001671 [Thoreauomyces humboldtii]